MWRGACGVARRRCRCRAYVETILVQPCTEYGAKALVILSVSGNWAYCTVYYCIIVIC
jgi:hypothetical protein